MISNILGQINSSLVLGALFIVALIIVFIRMFVRPNPAKVLARIAGLDEDIVSLRKSLTSPALYGPERGAHEKRLRRLEALRISLSRALRD